MIDPHMFLASRQAREAKADAKAKAKTSASSSTDTQVNSKSSSVDSKSQQSSYMGGGSLTPSSTTSTDPATKASLGGSSNSGSGAASSLHHKLPELEHFRQSPLMPEFFPRTSEFFSQGRRKSSVAITGDASAASAAGAEAPSPPPKKEAPKKPAGFRLPYPFQETEALIGKQLPVRLGLAPPSHSHGLPASEITYKAKVGHGFYFYTPPPARTSAAPAQTTTTSASARRRNTDTSESSLLYALPSGSTDTTKRPRRPPPSPDCWHPDQYFISSRSRVKGKMREHRYHAFPTSVVPYWHGYTDETIEAEYGIHLNVQHALHGNTLRPIPEETRPARVLDLGCGRGVWCLEMAREWKNTEFVGVDIVPIAPPMETLGDPDLEQRVTWVVANFLEPLPFPDGSFDFIHSRYLDQAIPEDKWVDFFSEARRLLAPGGVLEVLEGNFTFFGHASIIDVQDLKDLEQGKLAQRKGGGVKLPKRLKVLNDGADAAQIDAVEVVVERMMQRRFINPTPLSVVPSALLLPGFSHVANGNPRHIPVHAESSAQRARKSNAATPSSGTTTSSEDEKKEGKFTSRGQIGQPLKSRFSMDDIDLWRALVILQQLSHFSSSRELIWAEAEEEKRGLHGVPQPELPKMDATRRFGQGNPAALKPFAHPWKSKDEFFRAMDHWVDLRRASADTEYMLKKYLDWEQTHDELTVEGRKVAERRRKMSISTTMPSAVGLDPAVLQESEDHSSKAEEEREEHEREDALAAVSEVDQALETGAIAGDVSPRSGAHHEAPARLQTMRASAPNALDLKALPPKPTEADGAKGETKKKKSYKRPSSSGGIGSGSSIAGAPNRSRVFGREGARIGGLPPAIPDAPAFMPGSACAAPTPMDLRGPLTKARIDPTATATAAALSKRKTSSSKSSSLSGRTEKDDAKSKPTPPPAMAADAVEAGPGAGISPAAAYAASQRVSHGLEEEFKMQSRGDGERERSRPGSPTHVAATAPPPRTTSSALGVGVGVGGARPGGADAKSVSMPAQVGVRIAEPPARSKSKPTGSSTTTSAKTVALIGFYDTTGFIAIA